MGIFTVYVTKTVNQKWEVEAETENEARIIYDIKGVLKSDSIDSVEIEVED